MSQHFVNPWKWPRVWHSITVQGMVVSAHMWSPPPLFFSANKNGAPYGKLLGTIRPLSINSLIYFYSSWSSRDDMGYSFCFFGYTLGSIRGMVHGTQFSVIGYSGSANIYGWEVLSSFKSSWAPSNQASCTCPPWADQWVKFRSPTCSTSARYTRNTAVIFANLEADTHSQSHTDSNTIAP